MSKGMYMRSPATLTKLRKNNLAYQETRTSSAYGLKVCEYCGISFKTRLILGRRFCSSSCKTKEQFSDPTNHPNWKGKPGNTSATHRWIGRIRIKPSMCDWCDAPERKAKDGRSLLFWANLSGEYLRDLNDWACLCMNCHWKLDNQIAKLQRAGANL